MSVIYVSYDGIDEPLGRSQVLAYLERLASEFDITLISFEKNGAQIGALQSHVAAMGIEWIPLRYHRRPAVLSTAFDIRAGRRAIERAARRRRPDVVHVRSYVPALMALRARRATGGKLLFDIRGFWADERVEGGLWRAHGLLYRVAKRYERLFFATADAVVTLTEASVPQIESWLGGRRVAIDVIPTCVDTRKYEGRPPRDGEPHAVWSGSIGTWYRFDLASRMAAALAMPLTVVTRQAGLARELLHGYPATVGSALPEQMPAELFAGDVGLALIKSSFSKIASAPTRFAEFLAAGMPVLVTPEVGDLESIVTDDRVGVVLRGEDDASIDAAARAMRELLADPQLAARCRAVAAERFDLAHGGAQYAAIYEQLARDD